MDWKALSGPASRAIGAVTGMAAIPAFVLITLTAASSGGDGIPPVGTAAIMETLESREAVLARELGEVQAWYRRDVAPVEQVLRPFHEDGRWVRRISLALLREGRNVEMDPRVLASVLLVENPWLDPTARSTQGAVGLMQVMPMHAGDWGCPSADLTVPEVNICHGARIFAHYLDRYDGNIDRALLAYNGCVRGTNTPDCHRYPNHVYARAGRAALQRWLAMD